MNTTLVHIKVILGSTRPNRFSEKPGAWIMEHLKKTEGVEAELLDLREYPMPFYDEAATPSSTKEAFPVAKKWAEKIQEADAYIIVAPEYNHGTSAVLKNALDYVFFPWHNKAVGFVSYGSVGGGRAVEQLRLVAVELNMVPIRNAVHIPAPWNMLEKDGSLKAGSLEAFDHSAQNMIEQLLWWARATKAARS